MASITTHPDGRRDVQFTAADGKRRTIRLGKVAMRQAQSVRDRVVDLNQARITGTSPKDETSRWVSGLGDVMHERFARVGLAEPRRNKQGATVGGFTESYILGRADVKPRTVVNLTQARKAMLRFFGADKPLSSITPGDAEDFRSHLLGRKLAENTVRRICGRARQFFRAAIRRELVARNPFDGIKCTVGSNQSRLRFISGDDARRVLDACPDAEWRLIFALCRYGGLRCPSELRELTWADVDWESGRLTVRSPKTEHHEGKASRLVPIFPELLPHLQAAYDAAEPGSIHVVPRCRDSGVNLRTHLTRIIRRAGLEPWPKLFHNLRATRQTELVEDFPLHVVCSWLGNSPTIANKHYCQVTDDHFARAVSEATPAMQNPMQQAHAKTRKAMQAVPGGFSHVSSPHEVAFPCALMPAQGMPPDGLEPSTR